MSSIPNSYQKKTHIRNSIRAILGETFYNTFSFIFHLKLSSRLAFFSISDKLFIKFNRQNSIHGVIDTFNNHDRYLQGNSFDNILSIVSINIIRLSKSVINSRLGFKDNRRLFRSRE
jgi:hypothetical protein